MIFISHRSNLHGFHTATYGENHPNSILEAVKHGVDVEIDVWLIDGRYVLGHDAPQYQVDFSFLQSKYYWCHAKNLPAFHSLMNNNIHCFFHDTDAATLTSEKWIWTYPGQPILTPLAIAVMPERIQNYDISQAGGICSDVILNLLPKYRSA